jgi:nickel superoxide dismutase
MEFTRHISKFFPVYVAEAHCDIPCGVYDPTPAKIAAKTVQRMVMQIDELEMPQDKDKAAFTAYHNSVARRIKVKEEHAEVCKRELSTLWSDFFKPEHLKGAPNLHDLFWGALKLCSKNKQHVDRDAADELVAVVDEIARVFYKTKGDEKRLAAYRTITDSLF